MVSDNIIFRATPAYVPLRVTSWNLFRAYAAWLQLDEYFTLTFAAYRAYLMA